MHHIGTSGWSYPHWKEFFPKELKSTNWLGYYSSHFFKTVEINTTFYHVPLVTTVKNWHTQVPDDFIFSIKASRYITHMKRLHDCAEALKIFYKGIEGLKEKRGPTLFQLPPFFKVDTERLLTFINLLSKEHKHVFEFRNVSWYTQEVYDLLSSRNIALCITDLKGKLSPQEITADFTYLRLHGPQRAYSGSYSLATLKAWKKRIDTWTTRIPVYCYFDNDEKGFAVKDALRLSDLLNS